MNDMCHRRIIGLTGTPNHLQCKSAALHPAQVGLQAGICMHRDALTEGCKAGAGLEGLRCCTGCKQHNGCYSHCHCNLLQRGLLRHDKASQLIPRQKSRLLAARNASG